MHWSSILSLGGTALELGLISSLTVLSLFLSYSMLNVCDLSTDGCFTLGAAVGAMVALSGHPFLSIPAAILAGMLSGFVTAFLQTRMGIDSLLSGIIVNTGLYSVNIAVMKKSSLVNLNKVPTVFSLLKNFLENSQVSKKLHLTVLAPAYKIIVALFFVTLAVVFLSLFLTTRLGLAIRATGDNPVMVRSSSINPVMTTTVGLVLSNGLTGLSGCLLAQSEKSANIDIGTGMLTVALASLLIGRLFVRKGKIAPKAIGAVLGAVAFRLVYTVALRFNMPAFLLKLVSAVIVVIAISSDYLRSRIPVMRQKLAAKKEGRNRTHA